MSTTPVETPAQFTAHPDWCDRQNCYSDAGGRGHHASLPKQTMKNAKHGVAITYTASETPGMVPVLRLSGPHIKGSLSAYQLGRLAEVLRKAEKDLDAWMASEGVLPAPVEQVLEDGRRQVVTSSTEIHPAWCSPADCIHEHGEAPSHRSMDYKCPAVGPSDDFEATIVQDALGHPEIMSYGPSWDVPITPGAARAYARMLMRVADIAEGKKVAA